MTQTLAPPAPAPTRAAVPGTAPDPRLRALAAAHGLTVSGARPPLTAYTRQLWARRHFIASFATARLTAQYATARLGQIWQVATPLLNAGVYYLIFGVLLHTRDDIPDFIPFLCTGVFVFTFTQSAVLAGTRAISGNLGLVRALHFPRACLPIALTLIQLQQLLLSMGVLAAIVLVCGVPLTWHWLLMIPALLLQSVFNTGLALIMARIGARTTDTAQLMPFVLRTWMYASGVFYDLSAFTRTAPHLVAVLLDCNPTLIYIDLMRYALIDTARAAPLPPHVWPLALTWAVLAGVVGYLYFWKAEEEYGRG
ncbi:ABC transporter permease [Streptomyces piniterrae]|uniref:Transport permease protein n=1 Tax=Streptomyces piniterrae TaxID=2571125 RepID=A0A4U0NNL0_9ACTN|nr:ABC transporter permease [Streptomyces piniterrae]TJZ56081.1 ABC transporter permease [Streptomyces piniterrae]